MELEVSEDTTVEVGEDTTEVEKTSNLIQTSLSLFKIIGRPWFLRAHACTRQCRSVSATSPEALDRACPCSVAASTQIRIYKVNIMNAWFFKYGV